MACSRWGSRWVARGEFGVGVGTTQQFRMNVGEKHRNVGKEAKFRDGHCFVFRGRGRRRVGTVTVHSYHSRRVQLHFTPFSLLPLSFGSRCWPWTCPPTRICAISLNYLFVSGRRLDIQSQCLSSKVTDIRFLES